MEKKKFEQKNGTGVLFTNNKRETEKHPTMTGKIVTPDGIEYRISAWTKEGANGKYLSLALSENKEFTKEKKESNTPFNDLPF
tara:strand:+ start:29 stop:277 length:249 start_codon:yes stop_codon:yes gene_type:complete